MCAHVFNKNTMRNMNIKKYKNVRKPNTANTASKKGWDNEGLRDALTGTGSGTAKIWTLG